MCTYTRRTPRRCSRCVKSRRDAINLDQSRERSIFHETNSFGRRKIVIHANVAIHIVMSQHFRANTNWKFSTVRCCAHWWKNIQSNEISRPTQTHSRVTRILIIGWTLLTTTNNTCQCVCVCVCVTFGRNGHIFKVSSYQQRTVHISILKKSVKNV